MKWIGLPLSIFALFLASVNISLLDLPVGWRIVNVVILLTNTYWIGYAVGKEKENEEQQRK